MPTEDPAYRYDVAPTLVSTTGGSSAIEVGRAEELQATLGSHEFYKTALSGTSNDIVWVARNPGTSALTVTYVVSGASTELDVTKTTNDITVTVATSAGSAATSTANDIIDYVNTDESASEVEQAVYLMLAPSNDGTGVVAALSQQSLAGPTGSTPTLTVKLQSSIDDGSTWSDVGTYTQLTGTASTEGKTFVGLGDKSKWVWTLGGTSSPEFVISIASSAKGE
jgi:hypothetical protein